MRQANWFDNKLYKDFYCGFGMLKCHCTINGDNKLHVKNDSLYRRCLTQCVIGNCVFVKS